MFHCISHFLLTWCRYRPIHDAIEIGNVDMVRLLVERGADLLVEFGERTAVEFARDHRQLEIADYIKGASETV